MISNLQAVRQAFDETSAHRCSGFRNRLQAQSFCRDRSDDDTRHTATQISSEPETENRGANCVDYRFNYSVHGVFARFGRTFESS